VLSLVRPDAKLIFEVNKFDTSLLGGVTTMIYGNVNSSNRRWYKIMGILPRHMTQNPDRRIIPAVNYVDNSVPVELSTDCITGRFETSVYSSE